MNAPKIVIDQDSLRNAFSYGFIINAYPTNLDPKIPEVPEQSYYDALGELVAAQQAQAEEQGER